MSSADILEEKLRGRLDLLSCSSGQAELEVDLGTE